MIFYTNILEKREKNAERARNASMHAISTIFHQKHL
jgi:hypothetical protein